MFRSDKFENYLRAAGQALDDACDELDKAEPGDIAPPGADYLLARLHIALEVVETELPEFKKVAFLSAARQMENEYGT